MSNLNLKSVIEKVKSRGYWRLVIEPIDNIPSPFEHSRDAEPILNDALIKLRGWYYPHIPQQNNDHQRINIEDNRLDGYIIMDHFLEAWSYFISGQFVHLLGLREDWFKESGWFEEGHYLKKVEPRTKLDFVGVTLTLTEMFLFANNLINKVNYGGSFRIIITLNNGENRTLTTFDPRRIPMFFNYESSAVTMTAFNAIVTVEELNKSTLELAEKAAVRIFKYFKDFNPPVQVIKDDQIKLIERRL
ncbi:hypothetical protein HYS96_00655 [Candidatus Daviesbacteria bacterium]|nr:hypothetical protein [Candidatus Daviesbacteria bacterium]